MGRSQPPVRVVYTGQAQRDLDETFEWNARHYGSARAETYIQFLVASIAKLTEAPYSCPLIPSGDAIRFFVIKKARSRSNYGHIAVYEVIEDNLVVHHVFHSAQNWLGYSKN